MTEEIPQSHIKLATTVTAGAGGEHSPYYRRMLSSGYKGFIQGTIGGATLYGGFGTAIGALVAVGLAFASIPAAWLAIPICAVAGVIKGADTFGQIGANAAIYAEGAEMNERRRALLDRLQETNSQKEADEIINLLHQETKEKTPQSPIHWKSVIIGALLGAVLVGGLAAVAVMAPQLGLHVIADGLTKFMFDSAAYALVPTAAIVGAGAGALAGATIGIDRYYIRKWFDASENIIHDAGENRSIALERQREATRLHQIAKTDERNAMRIDVQQAPATNPPVARYEADDQTKPRVKVEATSVAPQSERLKTAEEAMKVGL